LIHFYKRVISQIKVMEVDPRRPDRIVRFASPLVTISESEKKEPVSEDLMADYIGSFQDAYLEPLTTAVTSEHPEYEFRGN